MTRSLTQPFAGKSFASSVLLLALLISAFAARAQDATSLAQLRLVDLSHTYDDSTLFWPTSPMAFEHKALAFGPSGNGYFYSAYTFETPEHGGTHLDAPIHFAREGKTVGQLTLDELFAPVVVIDITEQVDQDRDYLLSVADIQDFEQAFGPISPGTAVLVRTDWSRYWPDALAYLGDDTPGSADNLSFPGIGRAAALALAERDIAMLGIDTASIDYGKSVDFAVHVVVAEMEIPALENLTNLASLPQVGAYLLAAPMKIGEGSGAPTRVIGFIAD